MALILILFTLCLLLVRKTESLLIKRILEISQKIGEKILKINTELLKVFGLYRSPSM